MENLGSLLYCNLVLIKSRAKFQGDPTTCLAFVFQLEAADGASVRRQVAVDEDVLVRLGLVPELLQALDALPLEEAVGPVLVADDVRLRLELRSADVAAVALHGAGRRASHSSPPWPT